MILVRQIKTAMRVFRDEGLVALGKATADYLSRRRQFRPDEAKIAYDALNANSFKGLMIDVGAHYGLSLLLFAESGWNVLGLEPDPNNREKLNAAVNELPNVKVDARAVSDHIQENVTFYSSDESSGISGLSSFHTSHKPSNTVNITTLTSLIDEYAIGDNTIDFLKIDTEGFDLFVLKGFPWQHSRPRIIVCEFEDAKTTPLGYTFNDIADYLVQHGYKLIISEWYPITRYGAVHDWRRFAEYPCELMDSNAWGNIIAAKEENTYNNLLKICKL